MIFQLKSVVKLRLADTETPVSLYLKLRDRFSETLLLEHIERFHKEGGFSYICCDPIAGIQLSNNMLIKQYPDGKTLKTNITADTNVVNEIDDFIKSFVGADIHAPVVNSFFGYFNYDAAKHFEHIALSTSADATKQIPEIHLSIYRYIIVFDHFRNELSIVHLYFNEADHAGIEQIEGFLNSIITSYPFKTTSGEQSNFSEEEFLSIITKGKQHCFRGDVFQVVLSREFQVSFSGDEFNVYRALRSINPSPYLFFFDYGTYRLFGSSPEAQLKIKNGKAIVHPIAGTYRRTGNAVQDAALAEALRNDEKENAEHVMLIDLARNDLSKSYRNVNVPVFKTIQQFSHVLHIVSEVTGEDAIDNVRPIKVLADTFPAGTLSGAPKHMAMRLIDKYENHNRGFYGGCAGYIGFNGYLHQAIMIRTFLSKNNKLYYRAGAGITAASVEQRELEEVNNKIAALRKAIQLANTTSNETTDN